MTRVSSYLNRRGDLSFEFLAGVRLRYFRHSVLSAGVTGSTITQICMLYPTFTAIDLHPTFLSALLYLDA